MSTTARMPGKKLFILSEYVYAAENSTGYFWSKIIKRLAATQSNLHVLAPRTTEAESQRHGLDGVFYHDFRRVAFNKNRLISRLVGQFRLALGFLKLLRQQVRRGDVLVSGTNPVTLLIFVPLVRRLLGFRWVLLVHDVYPDNLVPAGILNQRSLAYRSLAGYFSWVYRSADLVFVIGRDMQCLIAEKVGSQDRVRYVPNWVDENDVVPMQRSDSEILRKLGWDREDKVVFQFFGNLGRLQGIDNILAAIRLIKHPNAAFLFIGSGAKADAVMEFIASYSSSNVVYLGPLEQAQKNQGLAACDVALITLEKGMAGLGVPSKAYFSMAADKPLLAVMESESEIARTVGEHQIGWVCVPGNPAALAQLIDHICDQVQPVPLGRSRDVFEHHYAEKVGLERFVREVLLLAETTAQSAAPSCGPIP